MKKFFVLISMFSLFTTVVFAGGEVTCSSIPFDTTKIVAKFDNAGKASVNLSELADGPGSWSDTFEGTVETCQVGFAESLVITIMFDGPDGSISARKERGNDKFIGKLETPYGSDEVECNIEFK